LLSIPWPSCYTDHRKPSKSKLGYLLRLHAPRRWSHSASPKRWKEPVDLDQSVCCRTRDAQNKLG
jgi:hypothetical protein